MSLEWSGLVNKKTLITKVTPITGSEDIPMFVHALEGLKMAYDFISTVDPMLVVTAKVKGREVP